MRFPSLNKKLNAGIYHLKMYTFTYANILQSLSCSLYSNCDVKSKKRIFPSVAGNANNNDKFKVILRVNMQSEIFFVVAVLFSLFKSHCLRDLKCCVKRSKNCIKKTNLQN